MSLRRWGLAVVALVGVALAGCDAVPGDSASAASVRDSASVRIVTSSGPDRLLVTREVLRIGAIEAEPAYLFDAIRSVAVAADGSIWVSDSHPTIRRYSAEGEYLNSAGGEGEGPGESARGYGDVWVGHGVVLVDGYSPPTLQRFGFGGDFRGARSQIRSDGPPHFPLGASSVGWYLQSETIPTDEGDRVRSRWTVWHGDALGGPVDSILVLPGQPRVRRRPRSWSSGSYFDGFPSLGAAGEHLYYSDALEYEVRIFGRTGSLGRVIRRDVAPTGVDPAIMVALEEEAEIGWSETLGSPIDRTGRDALLRSMEPVGDPDHLPFLDLVMPAPDGTIWVRRADRHPNVAALAVARAMGFIRTAWPDRWKADTVLDVFDPDGAYRGTVTFPPEFAPLDVTGGRIYGTLTDELDVQYVVAYEIEDPTP